MATLAQIMDQLATQISDVLEQVADVDVQVEPRRVFVPTPPCVDIYPADPSTDETLAGFGDLDGGELFTVRARIALADVDAGQDLLLALMDDEDPLSIAAAVEDDATLGGLASDVAVRSRSGYVLTQDIPAVEVFLGCLWQVVVIKARS